jgi:hypothetical protein
MDFKDLERMPTAFGYLGYEIDEELSGMVTSGSDYRARTVVLRKRGSAEMSVQDCVKQMGKENIPGLKLKKSGSGIGGDSRRIIQSFEVNGDVYQVELNEEDRAVLAEEQAFDVLGSELKLEYVDVEQIPREEIEDNELIRLRVGRRYRLYKALGGDSGIVSMD